MSVPQKKFELGDRVGSWTIKEYLGCVKGKPRWLLECDCGTTRVKTTDKVTLCNGCNNCDSVKRREIVEARISARSLRYNFTFDISDTQVVYTCNCCGTSQTKDLYSKVTTCWCSRNLPKNYPYPRTPWVCNIPYGEKKNRLTLVHVTKGPKYLLATCLCDCGNTTVTSYTSGFGKQVSCGCYRNERSEAFNSVHFKEQRDKKTALGIDTYSDFLTDNRRNMNWVKKYRDNYTCQLCGITLPSQDLHAHHITPVSKDPSKALDIANLITLCRVCHKKAHGDSWEDVDPELQISLASIAIKRSLGHSKLVSRVDVVNLPQDALYAILRARKVYKKYGRLRDCTPLQNLG